MKWIGQNIYDQISRFRNDVHVTGDLTVTGDNIIFQSANADDPLVTIKNTSNAANDMARLNFVKERDGGTAAANDNCAEIRFLSKNASGSEQQYGLMLSEIDVATHGQESGRLKLGVASHDGENSYGLQITGGSVDNEVDVLLGTGDASETTITGTLTMGSTATIDNSGAWVGGVIPSAKLDADTAHLSVDNVFTGATQTITSDGGGRPSMVIQNTGNNADGGFLQFKLDKGAVGADDDRPGNIQWKSDNDAQQQSTFGTIYTLVSDATDGEEAGDMHLQVASYDGTLRSGLYLDGDTNALGEVDVTVAAGAASTTTIAGTLTMGSTAALTNAGLVAVANQSNITGLGTISSGVWNGTDVGVAHGGTGVSTLGADAVLIGNGTSAITSSTNLTFDDTDLSLAGAGKMEFRGTGSYINSPDTNDLEIVAADITLDASGVIKLEGPVRPTGQIVLMRAAFKDDIGTTKHYIPLQSELEQTSATHEMNSFVAPFAGKLLKIMYRGSGNFSASSAEFTFTLEQIPRNVAFTTTATTLETIAIAGPTNNTTDPNMVIANFVGGSGTNAFTAGDIIQVGIQSDTDVTASTSKHFFTLVFEFDFSSLA